VRAGESIRRRRGDAVRRDPAFVAEIAAIKGRLKK
jgi:hypothetical protein